MILGIDPGTATVGYSVVSGTKQKPVIHDYGVITTAPREDFGGRLLEISWDLEAIIKQHDITDCVLEDLFFFKNAKTVITVAQARGVIMYLLAKNNIKIHSVTPLQVKAAMCGYGRASKEQVQKMVKKIYGLESIPKPDDAADALAMGWYGLA